MDVAALSRKVDIRFVVSIPNDRRRIIHPLVVARRVLSTTAEAVHCRVQDVLLVDHFRGMPDAKPNESDNYHNHYDGEDQYIFKVHGRLFGGTSGYSFIARYSVRQAV